MPGSATGIFTFSLTGYGVFPALILDGVPGMVTSAEPNPLFLEQLINQFCTMKS